MKLLIASDIHGSAYWTEKVLCTFSSGNADRLVLLGDILYHGPRNPLPEEHNPAKVAELLNSVSEKITAVRGNCEAEVDSLMLDFPVTPDYGFAYDCSRLLYFSHGHREIPKLPAGSLYFTGHTHIPHDYYENGVRFLNSGSVSMPKNGTPHSVILYDNGNVIWINIETDSTYEVK